MKIILASSNKKKLIEFSSFFNEFNISVHLASDFVDNFNPIEDGNSFKQNAKIKAKALYDSLDEKIKDEYCILADDSGLCVEALDNLPGIYSARYANASSGDIDAANRQKIKDEFKRLKIDYSKAAFICVLCFINKDKILFAKGVCDGVISKEESGMNGFGYDSMFYANNFSKSFAELSLLEKNKISHRYLALSDLIKQLGF
ncbi:RdgB/HAM1 family non-canonical purine NTP pyrophosphatase [Campylobacter canadensis]|uniref:dITP/XTP pyrophosphatase n=1 Tax=Campylobacter canadensis TaxID=449520 RepID=A0ABS7WSZ0_9BACT|nr:RdgB/HAM1 family non-canonical purine NTP pyrophosphatase [Campylobacter canadensis]MBZ7987054.1 RdgB/HAM1 family non-canonical purine NTP pyrophosphatase [Campylobacter canadensis]MBZ7994668.1 RdgB/HAM1 family non-canonical purine NTP pyrophosphatase [Campylobacter canadensis]MBZ7996164.1 RdgB/HAM1 family non-canonical purine NTP pyrophosphatase [Campylobacter canadensis]MBZ7998090.1 RdgB/HAM1 family non-canonical purine NTP pyrophosphatase [Campylobacter canadensis]MBZ8000020.1 RdgB/HAM1 